MGLDYNGDLRDLFHGTKNVDGQIVMAVSVIQKLPEIARSTKTSTEVMAFYEHLTSKGSNTRSLKERINENAHVLGSLERVWSGSTLLSEKQLATLPRHYSRMWMFRRCLVDGVLYHSSSYKRVVARNDYTVEFQDMEGRTSYGTVETYVKVQEKCLKAMCSDRKCCCTLASQFLAIVEVLLPKYRERTVVSHITRVKTSNRIMAVPVANILRKFLKVKVSSGCFICTLPNPYEKD